MNIEDMETEKEAAELCDDIQVKLNLLQEKGYAGLLLIEAPDGRPYMVQAGEAGRLLKMVGHTALPSLVYEDSCSKEDEGEFLRDVVSTVTESMEEK